MLGIPSANGENIGSGGWSNIIAKFIKAKSYCEKPFEIFHKAGRKVVVDIQGEWIGEGNNPPDLASYRKLELFCADAAEAVIEPGKLDAVLTDPPYFGNVQYAELMDFCYVWLRKLVGKNVPGFAKASTRNSMELTGNENMGRGLEHFTEGLSSVFRKMAVALKPGAPLAFTYHHNRLEAYYPVAVAILDSGLTCSASLPCPGEMGASIHISGTKSSILDTVFVCRSTGKVPAKWIVDSPEDVAGLIRMDLSKLSDVRNFTATLGDIRCIIFGHLTRLAVWNLRGGWDLSLSATQRMESVARWITAFGDLASVEQHLVDVLSTSPKFQKTSIREPQTSYGGTSAQISF